MGKMLISDHSKCTGCRLCEAVCSANKSGAVNPAKARIAIIRWESDCVQIPIICTQCEAAPCRAVCPVRAIAEDERLNRVVIKYDSCIGCRLCLTVCPFGAMGFDDGARRVFKCDLCEGDPLCARVCESGALRYEEPTANQRARMRRAAEMLRRSVETDR